ncbi:MAG: hypothetical protein AAF789_07270 [Bacteroidota bacterium]
MKKVGLVLWLLVGLVVGASSQSREVVEGDSIPWELRKQSFIYNSAIMFNDPIVARMALYNLLAENPGNVALYDSLALSYLQYQKNASAALVAQQAVQINPKDQFALEIAATSFDQLGVKDRALSFYEKLQLLNDDLNTLYKIAFLQLELDRYSEAATSVDIIKENPGSETLSIGFPKTDKSYQDVPLRAAAHRIKAMIAQDKGETEEAKKLFLETLEMSPGFELVQIQLRELTKKPAE